MGGLDRRIGFRLWHRIPGQIGVGGPLGVDMDPYVRVLRVADLDVCVGEQIDGR